MFIIIGANSKISINKTFPYRENQLDALVKKIIWFPNPHFILSPLHPMSRLPPCSTMYIFGFIVLNWDIPGNRTNYPQKNYLAWIGSGLIFFNIYVSEPFDESEILGGTKLQDETWFHGCISRQTAEAALKNVSLILF